MREAGGDSGRRAREFRCWFSRLSAIDTRTARGDSMRVGNGQGTNATVVRGVPRAWRAILITSTTVLTMSCGQGHPPWAPPSPTPPDGGDAQRDSGDAQRVAVTRSPM